MSEQSRPLESGKPNDDTGIPEFLKRKAPSAPASEADAAAEDDGDDEAGAEDGDALGFEDPEPPYKAGKPSPEETRAAEQELERRKSGFTAEAVLGANGKPLVLGDPAVVTFGKGKNHFEKAGTLIAIEGPDARVRLNGEKEPMGSVYPLERVSTTPFNGGKPLKSKAEKKAAAVHGHHVAEYNDALANPKKAKGARPADGFDHAQRAADEETAPLPKKVLQGRGHNGGVGEETVYRHLGAIRAKQAAKDKAVADLRNAWKKAKDDGVPEKALKQVMKEMGISPDELIADINELNAMRAVVRLPNTGPLDLESDQRLETPEQRAAHADLEGERAGLRGTDQSQNPFPDPNDPSSKAWIVGWQRGQAKLGMRIKKLDS